MFIFSLTLLGNSSLIISPRTVIFHRALGRKKLILRCNCWMVNKTVTVSESRAASSVWSHMTDTQVRGIRQRSCRGREGAKELSYSVCVWEKEGEVEDKLGINWILSNWETIVCSSPLKHTNTCLTQAVRLRQVLSMTGEMDSTLYSIHTHTTNPLFLFSTLYSLPYL